MENNIKNSNIEILRIFAMLMIIAHHYCWHGVYNLCHCNTSLVCYLNNFIVGIATLGGKLGVDIFILITGYFMISSKYKFSRFIKIYLSTLFYSLLFLMLAYIFAKQQISQITINSSLFPFGGNAYWFITTYLMLYILIPFINNFIHKTKKSMLNSLMIITTILWIIIPTFTNANYCFSNLVWFIYLYLVGASIKLKSFAGIFNNKNFIKKIFLLSCTILVSYVFIKCVNNQINLVNMEKISRMQSLYIFSVAIYLFHFFKDLTITNSMLINQVSSSVLGVYLIHDNFIVRPFIWLLLFHPYTMIDKSYMILHLFTVTLIVFIFCVVIDKFKILIFNKIASLLNKFDTTKIKKYNRQLIKLMYKFNKI